MAKERVNGEKEMKREEKNIEKRGGEGREEKGEGRGGGKKRGKRQSQPFPFSTRTASVTWLSEMPSSSLTLRFVRLLFPVLLALYSWEMILSFPRFVYVFVSCLTNDRWDHLPVDCQPALTSSKCVPHPLPTQVQAVFYHAPLSVLSAMSAILQISLEQRNWHPGPPFGVNNRTPLHSISGTWNCFFLM